MSESPDSIIDTTEICESRLAGLSPESSFLQPNLAHPSMADILHRATAQLALVSATARLDAEILLAHALGWERSALLLSDPTQFQAHFYASSTGSTEADYPTIFARLIARRYAHEPVAYIIGWQDFWTVRLRVGPGALIPRPDSETLIEAAIAVIATHRLAGCGGAGPRTILDIGTGPGTLLLAALDHWPSAHGVGVDISATALRYAHHNADRLGFEERTEWLQADWELPGDRERQQAGDLQGNCELPRNWNAIISRRFDLILCNPPYVESNAQLSPDIADYEPALALYAGLDGMDALRHIVPKLSAMMTLDGVAILEIGCGQVEEMSQLVRQCGLDMHIRRDMNGRERAAIISYSRNALRDVLYE